MPGISPAEFAELFARQRDRLHRFLHRLTRNGADADDLLQESFLTVWRKRDQYEGRGSCEGYLRRTAFRVYLNHRERTRRRADLATRSPERSDAVQTHGAVERRDAVTFLMERVRGCLDDLPDDAREAFVLFRFEGLTCREISELSGVPIKTVETRVRRATKQLGQRLRKYRDELPTQ